WQCLMKKPMSGNTDIFLTTNFALLCVGSLFFHISFHSLLSTLPTYILEIGGKEQQIGLIIGAFATSSLLFRLPVGWLLGHRNTTKYLIVVGTLIFLVSSFLYIFTKTVESLLALRLLHGAGIAAYTTAATTLVAHTTPVKRRGEAMSVFAIAATLSMGLGPFLGVILLRETDYRMLFLASTGCAFLGVILALPLKNGEDTPHESEQPKSRPPLFSKEALFPSFMIFVVCLTYGIVVSFLPPFTTKRHLGNPGSFFLTYAAVLMLCRAPAGRLSDTHGRGVVIVPGMAFIAISMWTLARANSPFELAVSAALYGLGFACTNSILMALAVDRAPQRERGAAVGMFTAGFELGIALGAIAFGAVLTATNFNVMFYSASGVAAIGGIAFLARSLRLHRI
ncbi:MAG: MFS transporter, partial [Armatimonadota bacterium]|nr:MFS transporter [Armatimonadota bacterium]